MSTVQDTDLLVINRAGVSYKATYADVKKGFGPQHINPAPGDWTFNPAIAGGTGTQADPFIITPETVNTPGGTVQSAQTLTLTGLTSNDLVEWTDLSTGTGDRFKQDLAIVPASGQVDLKLRYLDTPDSTVGATFTGDLQIGTSYFRWVVTQNVATVNKPSLLTPADGAGQTTQAVSDTITAAADTFTPDWGTPSQVLEVQNWTYSQSQVNNLFTANGNGLFLDSARDVGGSPQTAGIAKFQPTVPIGNVTSIQIYADADYTGPSYKNATVDYTINGGATQQITSSYTPTGSVPTFVHTIYSGPPITLTELTIGTWDNTGGTYIVSGIGVNGVQLISNLAVTKLTLASDKDLAKFAAGDAVQQDDAAASGIVAFTDATAKTITLSSSTGTWSANTGNWVVGPPKLSTDAAVGETPTFTSTAFGVTGGTGVTHASSDWQVTLKTDTGFASPVVQSMTDATNLVSWKGGPLQVKTDYIARVRHNGSGGLQSPWSDVINFRTKDSFSTIVSAPGQMWSVSGQTGALSYRTAPAKLTILSITDQVIAVGVDGKVYTGSANGPLAELTNPVTLSYEPISGISAYGTVPTLFVKPDGRLDAYKLDGTPVLLNYEIAAGVKVKEVCLTASRSAAAAVTDDGNLYYAIAADAGTSSWTLVSTGDKAGQVARVSYGASYLWDGTATATGDFTLLVVLKNGELWNCADVSAAWSNTGVTGVSQAVCLFTSGQYYYALASDGSKIYVGGNKTGAALPCPAFFSAPSGETFQSIGGTYKVGIFLTASGKVFTHQVPPGVGYTPIIGTASTDGSTMTEIDAPKPVSTLSMQHTSPGGYALGFIIPD